MVERIKNKKLVVYCLVLYGCFFISWLHMVSRDYLWTVCQLGLEPSKNPVDVWHQLTPVPKFITIVFIYITVHGLIVWIKGFKSKKTE